MHAAVSYLFPPEPSPAPLHLRNTKAIGDVSELEVALALVRAGYIVSKPLGENQRYDLIADNGRNLLRIQVKTGRLRSGVVRFSCCSTHGHRRGTMLSRPYLGQVDAFGVYCPQNRKVYLLPESSLVATSAHLRVLPTKNNNSKKIRWARDFELA